MDDSDTSAIIAEDLESSDSSKVCCCFKVPQNKRPPPCACPFPVTVEPVMFLSTFSIALQMPLCTQYLWDRISEDVGYNGTKGGGCNASTVHDPLQKVIDIWHFIWVRNPGLFFCSESSRFSTIVMNFFFPENQSKQFGSWTNDTSEQIFSESKTYNEAHLV